MVGVAREGVTHLLAGGLVGLGLHGGCKRVGLALDSIGGLLSASLLGVGLWMTISNEKKKI